MRALLSAAIVALSVGGAAAQTVTDHRLVVSPGGRVVVLSNWTCWNADCSFSNCRTDTTARPRGGTLSVRVVDGVIPANGGTCAGKPTKTLNVTYTPNPGFTGEDALTLTIRADNGGHYVRRYRIGVR